MRFRAYFSKDDTIVLNVPGWQEAVAEAVTLVTAGTGYLEALELEDMPPANNDRGPGWFIGGGPRL